MKLIKKITAILLLLIMLAVPQALLAEQDLSQTQGPDKPNLLGIGTDLTLEQAIVAVLNVILGLLGLISVIIIIFAGFKYMASGGDSEKAKSARKILTYALIGLIVIIFAMLISNYLLAVLYTSV